MDELGLSLHDGVATLLIDRPAKRNALSQAMLAALPELLSQAAADPQVRVLVLTGGAGRAFSAGADIEEFEQVYATPHSAAAFAALFAGAQTAVASFPKPSAAMISGACVGGGCGLALGCDVRFADTSARFGVTPARLGLAYALADTKRLTDAVGFEAAFDLLYSARLIDAEDALRIGLVGQVCAPEALEATVAAWTRRVAANASSSLAAVKDMITRIRAGATADDAVTRAIFTDAFASADFAEGRRAFVEKRRPDFA
ncbi:MAG: enoyl-CoA hydratase-related protein [Caulobacteraceae bacterium]